MGPFVIDTKNRLWDPRDPSLSPPSVPSLSPPLPLSIPRRAETAGGARARRRGAQGRRRGGGHRARGRRRRRPPCALPVLLRRHLARHRWRRARYRRRCHCILPNLATWSSDPPTTAPDLAPLTGDGTRWRMPERTAIGGDGREGERGAAVDAGDGRGGPPRRPRSRVRREGEASAAAKKRE